MGPVDDVIQLCCYLISNEEIKATLQGSLSAGWTVGLITTAAGIALGPPGLLVGAVGGGLLTYDWFKDEFKALPKIIMELSDQKKQELYNQLMKVQVLRNMRWTDYAHLLSQVSAQPIVKQQILETLIQFFKR
ncbi:protein C19orf12 homolog [Hippoglossus hippoglossus]|uniref:protein C19orf12 homolog n=1 Tax=Hippoglossus hippoglossus TaxID=8267 RepID=UPI00148BC095|nr:protein C19orf12 homolog [Hippoglossus hippoglossus]XP_034467514.1 protein C19orf12 homolog [Hippoglossus hippoglossus]